MFSKLAGHFDQPSNRLYEERARLLQKGRKIINLVSGNVNAHGICFPKEILARAIKEAQKKAATYQPDPLGQEVAREAISRYYEGCGLRIPAEHILLTPGTSVSYWYAFKLLADEGDEILVPTPSYPLFDSIAMLCGVKLVPYRLRETHRWEIDFQSLEDAITPKTKAIILISPHNPTGAVATSKEVSQLANIAIKRNLAIIADEVFSSFVFSNDVFFRPACTKAPLVLTLNGLSKMLALPGIKVGWMAVTGYPDLVRRTMKTLDMISDTFLPVNEIAQLATPMILEKSGVFQRFYVAEVQKRMKFATHLLNVTSPEGGFFLTLPVHTNEEELALRLLQKHHVLVHPGYFYDMEGNHLVFSFVSKPVILRRVLQHIPTH